VKSLKKLTHWIAAKAIKDHQRVDDLKVRARYGALEGWASIIVNLLLFVVKMALGLSVKSVSLIADAVHTLADSGTSAVVIIGFKIAKRPSDKEHPFGHGRMESIAALVVSVLLFMAGVELLEKSIHAVVKPHSSTVPFSVILVILATIVIKELMSRFSYQLGEIIDSQALKADALHHRSDVIATAMVVVALIATRFGYNNIDGIMGAGVSLIIFYSAFSIAREAVNPLLGEAPSRETIEEIENLALAHEGILGIHDVIFHKYGQTGIISLHIEVSDSDSASKLHELSEEIEHDIARKTGGTVVIHVDPINKDHPQYEQVTRTIKEIVSEDGRVNTFHDLRIIGCKANRCNVVFDIVLEQDADEQETYDIIRSITEKFKTKFPEMKTIIKAEPKYAYSA
jgi:cation diffusion facilitator family transporter